MATPLFIIGTQRSGSNLLRLMLNESPEIVAPHPPHILKTFFPLLSQYGDLNQEASFAHLVRDICTFVQVNPVVWEYAPTFEQVWEMCQKRTLIEVMRCVYEVPAIARNTHYWCCKSMANVEYLPQLQAELPQAKYIYLYRDGRDVAVSFAKAVVGEKHFYSIATQWANDQRLALDFVKNANENQVFMLQYERFITHPEETLHQLCAFLDIPFRPQMMEYHTSEESKRTAASGEMWANVVKPVIAANQQKFLTEAAPEQIRIFETVAGDVLEELGYKCVNKMENRTPFSAQEIDGFVLENQQLKQQIRVKISADELAKRAGQEALLKEIQERNK